MMERRLVIRLHPWRQLPMTIMMVVVTVAEVWAWVMSNRFDKDLGFGAAFVVLWGIYIAEAVWIRLIVTPGHIRMISSHRDPPISREQIYNIRALRGNTVFYGHDQEPILETRMDLTRSQLLALANELHVNVWDHRVWHGLKELDHGVRLNPEPFPHHPPA